MLIHTQCDLLHGLGVFAILQDSALGNVHTVLQDSPFEECLWTAARFSPRGILLSGNLRAVLPDSSLGECSCTTARFSPHGMFVHCCKILPPGNVHARLWNSPLGEETRSLMEKSLCYESHPMTRLG